jgi:hypothetical protein
MVNSKSHDFSRRALLKGAGAALALPFMESLSPLKALEAAPSGHPLRLLYVFVPNGMHMPDWTPGGVGKSFVMSKTLKSLEAHRKELLVLSGLSLDAGFAHGDGPGDHARAAATFLTGMHPRKTGGANIKVGVSVDQIAAGVLGQKTRFPSLELGIERSRLSGSCDSGYSCAYSSNISWRSERSPNAKEFMPKRVFDRLFRSGGSGLSPEEAKRKAKFRGSILDAVLEDSKKLRGKMGLSDRRKLDEFMGSVREVEKRIDDPAGNKSSPAENYQVAKGVPKDMGRHVNQMYDLIRLAFQTDTTRVATYMVGNAGSNRSYRFLGVREGHHRLSHHGRDPKKHEKIAKINRFHVECFARFLSEMKKVKEGNGTLLDNTLIVFGSAISDGNRHNHNELPVLFAGGGDRVKSGRHLRFPKDTPLCSLYFSMLRQAGWRGSRFGDGYKVLPGLS